MSIKKNFIYNMVYQIIIIIIPLITTPYISRIIGPEGVGIQAYTYSIASYFVLFAMLGVNNHGNRSIAMTRNDKKRLSETFFCIFYLKVIVSVIVIIVYCIYIIFAQQQYRILLIINLLYVLAALVDINWFFFGMEKFKLTVIRNVVIRVISVISIFIFVKQSSDLYIYVFILALGNLISQLILWKYLFKYIDKTKVGIKNIFNQLKPTLVLFIPVLAISVYQIMDKIMIGYMSNVVQVGYYENSERIIKIPIAVIISLGTVMLPIARE